MGRMQVPCVPAVAPRPQDRPDKAWGGVVVTEVPYLKDHVPYTHTTTLSRVTWAVATVHRDRSGRVYFGHVSKFRWLYKYRLDSCRNKKSKNKSLMFRNGLLVMISVA